MPVSRRSFALCLHGLMMCGTSVAAPVSFACDEPTFQAALHFLDAPCMPAVAVSDDSPDIVYAAARACNVGQADAGGHVPSRQRRVGIPTCDDIIRQLLALYQQMFPDHMERAHFQRILWLAHLQSTTGAHGVNPADENRFIQAVSQLAQGNSGAMGNWEDPAMRAFDSLVSFPVPQSAQEAGPLHSMAASAYACNDSAAGTSATNAPGNIIRPYLMPLSGYQPRTVRPRYWRWRFAPVSGKPGPVLSALSRAPFTFTSTAPQFAVPGSRTGFEAFQARRQMLTAIASDWHNAMEKARNSVNTSGGLRWRARLLGCTARRLVATQIAVSDALRGDADGGEMIAVWHRGRPVGIARFHIEYDATGHATIRMDQRMLAPQILLAPFGADAIHGAFDALIDQLARAGQRLNIQAIRIDAAASMQSEIMEGLGFRLQSTDRPPSPPQHDAL